MPASVRHVATALAADVVALRELRRARRTNRAAQVDLFDAFYQAYLTAVACGAAVLIASDVVGDQRVGAASVARVVSHGPSWIGRAVGLAVVVGVGLRAVRGAL